MFKAFRAWRKLMRLMRKPEAWKIAKLGIARENYVRVEHGSHIAIEATEYRTCLILDCGSIPLGMWRCWRLRRAVTKLMLKKLVNSL